MVDDFFDDVPGVTARPGVYPASPEPQPGTVASGSFWTLFERDGGFVVEYISGEISGRARAVHVSLEDAETLKTAGDDAAASIINANGGS
jgi:hypothetical protein